MSRRDRWQKVLDMELRRWSALSLEELVAKLGDIECYEIEVDLETYQVEVQVLENTEAYLHVMVAVDDGTLPASLRPQSATFIRKKPPAVRT